MLDSNLENTFIDMPSARAMVVWQHRKKKCSNLKFSTVISSNIRRYLWLLSPSSNHRYFFVSPSYVCFIFIKDGKPKMFQDC